MKYTDIIWDFNGTIIDDIDVGILCVNKLLAKRGLKIIPDKNYYRRHFRFPIKEYYRSLGFDFEREPYEVIAPLWVEEYLKNCKDAPLREGVCDAIELFASLGARQHILSATERSMLCDQLDFYGIKDRFDSIWGLDNIEASSKTALAKKWREENPTSIVLFIGDTEHDYAAAVAMGADCALVCGGHQPSEVLERCGTALFDDFSSLCDFFAKN